MGDFRICISVPLKDMIFSDMIYFSYFVLIPRQTNFLRSMEDKSVLEINKYTCGKQLKLANHFFFFFLV